MGVESEGWRLLSAQYKSPECWVFPEVIETFADAEKGGNSLNIEE